MVQLTALLTLTTLLALSSAQDKKHPAVGFKKVPGKEAPEALNARSLLAERQTCSGTCSECFGSGYILCPSSSLYCYKPGDLTYGLDSCPGSSSDSASSAYPTSTGSAGNSDYCSGTGATCVSCFGAGYLECDDGINCYNPDDPRYDTCPDGSSSSGSGSSGSGSSGSGGSTTSSCETLHGAGNVPCGSDGCYNPDIGEVCCQDGYYCDAGETCSTNVGKCCTDSSTSDGCSGSGSGSGSGLSTSSSRTTSTRSTATSASTPTTFSNSGSSSSSSGSASGATSSVDVTMSKLAAVVLGAFGLVMVAL